MSDLGVDDWVTFYEGGTRLVDYLNHVGYNGLVIAALADGSTIYPSEVLEATPRYDTGLFLETGQDPVRKDVLEMLLRLFDREGLQLIPALEFGAPLPELEALLRRGGPEAEGITWVGPDGLTWLETYPPVRGMAPYYNVLHPRVQQAMLAVVHELVARYAQHPSFGGLAIQLTLQGYAQLPGPEWGLDDVTIARFQQETQIRVPGTDTAGVAAGANGPHRGTPSPLAPAARPDALPSGPASSPTAARGSGCNGGPTSWAASTAASNRSWPPSAPTPTSSSPRPVSSPATPGSGNSAPRCRSG